ncbi:hypothetical protein OS12_13650 [Dickeya oryzae]
MAGVVGVERHNAHPGEHGIADFVELITFSDVATDVIGVVQANDIIKTAFFLPASLF